MRSILLIVLILSSLASWAGTACQTVSLCPTGSSCLCTIPADSASDRYYYSQLVLDANHVYQCSMASSGGASMLVVNARMPEGTRLTCQASCQRFPVVFIIDTRDQSKPSDNGMLKYFIPDSDLPTDFKFSCSTIL
jgi:hypothetical protein